MRSRTFLHVSLGILALAVAYHLGARSATAQAPGNSVVGICPESGSGWILAITANGDTYRAGPAPTRTYSWERVGSVFGGPTPAQQESFGAVKARYR